MEDKTAQSPRSSDRSLLHPPPSEPNPSSIVAPTESWEAGLSYHTFSMTDSRFVKLEEGVEGGVLRLEGNMPDFGGRVERLCHVGMWGCRVGVLSPCVCERLFLISRLLEWQGGKSRRGTRRIERSTANWARSRCSHDDVSFLSHQLHG